MLDAPAPVPPAPVARRRYPSRRRHASVVREAAPAYLSGPDVPELGEAVDAVADGLDLLAAAELDHVGDLDLLDQLVELDRQAARLDAQRTRLLATIDRRRAYAEVGAITPAAWLRHATRTHPGRASARVSTGRRLRHLRVVAAAYLAGEITEAHADVVCRVATPRRLEAILAVEESLVDLARKASPKELARAVASIRDAVDPDGTDQPGEPDPDRYLHASVVEHGKVKLDGLIDQLPGEELLTLLHALSAPRPAEGGDPDPRTPAQRRHDGFVDLIRRAAASPDLPSVNRLPLHVHLTVDLARWLDPADPTAPVPRLRYTGDLHPDDARRIATAATRFQPLLTLGPFRAVSVGRTQRTLPGWLRGSLEALHHTCRGPACDTPVPWGDAHHLDEWGDGGETDLNLSLPLCGPHHGLLDRGWTVTLDLDTGTVTWTSPDGRDIEVPPPP